MHPIDMYGINGLLVPGKGHLFLLIKMVSKVLDNIGSFAKTFQYGVPAAIGVLFSDV